MEKIKLTTKQKEALKFIAFFYDKSKKGCTSASIIFDHKTLSDLVKDDLIFKNKEGWFPSTKGQDYIKLYGINKLNPENLKNLMDTIQKDDGSIIINFNK